MAIQPSPRQQIRGARARKDGQTELRRDLSALEHLLGQPLATSTTRGEVLNIDVDAVNLLTVCRFLYHQLGFNLLSSVSGVDMLDHLEVVYHVRALSRKQLIQLRVRVDSQQPELDSVVSIWPGSNWLEREVYDLFGVHFRGHPDLRRILLDDEFEGYPLLKSFQAMPPVLKDRATTQVGPNQAISPRFQTCGYEQGTAMRVGQGKEERLHPGTPTFGDTQDASQAGELGQP